MAATGRKSAAPAAGARLAIPPGLPENAGRPEPGARVIYKICPEAEWRQAERSGSFAGYGIDLADGYIHFSTAAQAEETAARHFAGLRDLVLVAVDPAGLGAALKWEPARGGALFPHLYAALPVARAAWVRPLPLGDDGRHRFPNGLA